jgi:hypothetical protein
MPTNYSQKVFDKSLHTILLNYSNLNLNENKIGLHIGYPNGDVPNHFKGIIKSILIQTGNKCNISAGYKILKLKYNEDNKNGIYLNDIFFKMSKIVTGQLKKASHAAIFLCSIGPKMENWSKDKLTEGDLLSGYLIDTVASVAVEEVANLLHDHIGNFAKDYLWNISNRYSPGYCNWNVSEQQKLFSFFPRGFCGVKLNESSLMSPIKSISGVIALGEDVKYAEYICDRCGIKDCTHRIYLKKKITNI